MEISDYRADIDARLSSVAALGEPVRRQLYRYVISQSEPVSREQAAAGVQVAHHVAKFHLDKLAEDGLLEIEYRRPAGRTGPGAGRPAKLYRRAERDIAVSLPERRYDLVGRLLAEAITTSETSGVPLGEALHDTAYGAGRELGERAGREPSARVSKDARTRTLCRVLEDTGYEPQVSPGGITLRNCPFHALAREHTQLVCGMNLDLISGVLDGLGKSKLRAHLDPDEARCCVTIT